MRRIRVPASILGLALLTGTAAAQSNPFYDQLSGASATEVRAWYGMYISRVDNGAPATGATTFTFSDPRLNSPLFSPRSAAVRTAAVATTGSADYTCVDETDLAATTSTGILANQVRSYMLSGLIVTGVSTDPLGTEAHAEAIVGAQAAGSTTVVASVQGDTLVSYGLPATTAQGGPVGSPIPATELELAWMGPLNAMTLGWAVQLRAEATQANRSTLLGVQGYLSEFKQGVDEYLAQQGLNAETYGVEAWFGTYGSLPIVVLNYSGGFLLIDAVDGFIDGPFAPGSPIVPSALLATHADVYVSGTPVMVVDATSLCGAGTGKTWHDTAPPGWVPAVPVTTPGDPANNPNDRPCHWSNYNCEFVLGKGCVCTSTGTGTSGTPPVTTTTKTVQVCPTTADSDCRATAKTYPPGPPPPMNTGCAAAVQYWFY